MKRKFGCLDKHIKYPNNSLRIRQTRIIQIKIYGIIVRYFPDQNYTYLVVSDILIHILKNTSCWILGLVRYIKMSIYICILFLKYSIIQTHHKHEDNLNFTSHKTNNKDFNMRVRDQRISAFPNSN